MQYSDHAPLGLLNQRLYTTGEVAEILGVDTLDVTAVAPRISGAGARIRSDLRPRGQVPRKRPRGLPGSAAHHASRVNPFSAVPFTGDLGAEATPHA